MALEPEIAAFVARVASEGGGGGGEPHAQSIDALRAGYERFAARWTPPLPDGVSMDDASWCAPAGHCIALRRYRRSASPPGTVLFFHGGGFVLGSLASHQSIASHIAADTGCDVVAVDYRLAPEHRAPAAHDDAHAVTQAALEGGLPFGGTVGPVAVAGDSAGGTLAASVAAWFGTRLAAAALVYPMLGLEPQAPARDTEADAPMLTLADVHTYRRFYWGDGVTSPGGEPPPPGTVPLLAERFDGLPPVLAVGAEHDPLRDDARVHIEMIRAAGGDARYLLAEGMVHGCWRALDVSPGAAAMHASVCAFLRGRLGAARAPNRA